MPITAKELIECIQGMSKEERFEITRALRVITCSEDYQSPPLVPAMPFCDPDEIRRHTLLHAARDK